MKIVKTAMEQSTVTISHKELLILNSALNEICNGIEVFEFETRIGANRHEVADLLSGIGAILDRMETS
jgi:hypothetical protein